MTPLAKEREVEEGAGLDIFLWSLLKLKSFQTFDLSHHPFTSHNHWWSLRRRRGMVFSSPLESESIETSKLPAVSSLKSHFEQIANTNSQLPASKKPTVSGLGFPTTASGLLTADRTVSPRQRTSSGDFHHRNDDHDDGQRPAVHLRSASSSSDLRSSKRPPPPPPPTRSTKPASPGPSPHLRPILISSLPNHSISLTKRPPPPIPSSPIHKSDMPLPSTGNVNSIRGKLQRFARL